jgi:glutamate dehydrogenase
VGKDFWLGDAFASGGSAGYDHKKMGITARGAWESVKKHFRDLGIDTQDAGGLHRWSGVGDHVRRRPSATGMLPPSHIRLVAAFDHRTSSLTRTGRRLSHERRRCSTAALLVGRLRHTRLIARAAASSRGPPSHPVTPQVRRPATRRRHRVSPAS